MKYYIYALVTGTDIFYIGRTIDPKRRLKEHQRDSKTGDELKYIFIRQLTECGGKWEMQILAEYSDNLHPYEDYWIYNCALQGIELTNMRAGDVYTEAENNLFKKKKVFNTAEDFFKERELEAKALTVHKKRKEYLSDSSRTRQAIGHVDKVSPGLAAIKAKQANKKNLLSQKT